MYQHWMLGLKSKNRWVLLTCKGIEDFWQKYQICHKHIKDVTSASKDVTAVSKDLTILSKMPQQYKICHNSSKEATTI